MNPFTSKLANFIKTLIVLSGEYVEGHVGGQCLDGPP